VRGSNFAAERPYREDLENQAQKETTARAK
jgi:hypothetical protein